MSHQVDKVVLGVQFLTRSSVSFWHLTCKNLHTKNTHVNWHTHFRILTCSVTCEGKSHTSIDKLEIKMARTRHMTSRWHFRRKNINVNGHFISSFENVMWHFGFEVERQMKFVTHILVILGFLQSIFQYFQTFVHGEPTVSYSWTGWVLRKKPVDA